MGPVIHACPTCRRRVPATPIAAVRHGDWEIPRWAVIEHRSVRNAFGPLCPGSSAIIEGAHRAARPVVQTELFAREAG